MRKKNQGKQLIPVGLEQVLFRGAEDPAFRRELLRDREAAVAARGWTLRESELSTLRLVPRTQLLASMEGLDTSTENLQRRVFMQAVAAGAMVVGAAGCSDDDEVVRAGIQPDHMVATGVRPDMATDASPPDARPPDSATADGTVDINAMDGVTHRADSTGIRPYDGANPGANPAKDPNIK